MNHDSSASRPNVLCIMTDDTDFSMLGYTGGGALTPAIDSIASGGVVCTQFHASSPVCTPSRYTYLTGHYAGRCPSPRFRDAFPPGEPHCILWNSDLRPEYEPCLGSVLQAGGYSTGYVGKWHAGGAQSLSRFQFERDDDPADPEVAAELLARQQELDRIVQSQGFDFTAALHQGNPDDHPIRRLHVHNLDWIAKGALDFIGQYAHGPKPFFLQVALTTIHGPSHIESAKDDPRLTTAGYLDGHVGYLPSRESLFTRLEEAGVEVTHRTVGALWTDDVVRALLDRLDDLAIRDNTVVIYCADHNAFDGKATCYQGGVHIPFTMAWPGSIPAGSRCEQLLQNIDFVPTMLDLCGVQPPADMVIDGKSFLPWVTGKENDEFRESLFFEWGYSRAVRTKRWKYIANRLPKRVIDKMRDGEVDRAFTMEGHSHNPLPVLRYRHYFDPDQLYDLEADPAEQNNLAAEPEHDGTVQRMRSLLRGYLDTFERPFDLDTVDAFLTSGRHAELAAATADVDMNQHEWYRMGWY